MTLGTTQVDWLLGEILEPLTAYKYFWYSFVFCWIILDMAADNLTIEGI